MEKQLDVFCGIDNGVTGTIAIIDANKKLLHWSKTPTFWCPSYTKEGRKKGRRDRRIDRVHLYYLLKEYRDRMAKVLIEYPMYSLDRERFHASISAAGSMADTRGVIEDLKIEHEFITAKDWQKVLLPKGVKDTKKASRDLAMEWYPKLKIPASLDGDGICIAEYGRRTGK